MTEQRIKSKEIKPIKGVLLILSIFVALVIASNLSNLLSRYIPAVWTQLAVWLLTGVFAVFLMREHIEEYHYTVSGGTLYVERLYGIRSKVLLSVPIGDIVAIGDEQTLRAAHPKLGRALNAALNGCPLPRKAVLYRKKASLEMIVLQPDEKIAALLWDEQARAAARRDKWGEP